MDDLVTTLMAACFVLTLLAILVLNDRAHRKTIERLNGMLDAKDAQLRDARSDRDVLTRVNEALRRKLRRRESVATGGPFRATHDLPVSQEAQGVLQELPEATVRLATHLRQEGAKAGVDLTEQAALEEAASMIRQAGL
jgi:hypothetical protein